MGEDRVTYSLADPIKLVVQYLFHDLLLRSNLYHGVCGVL